MGGISVRTDGKPVKIHTSHFLQIHSGSSRAWTNPSNLGVQNRPWTTCTASHACCNTLTMLATQYAPRAHSALSHKNKGSC